MDKIFGSKYLCSYSEVLIFWENFPTGIFQDTDGELETFISPSHFS